MTQTNPEQWADKVLDDVIVAWIEHGHSAGIEAIQAAFTEREARLVGAITSTNAMACTPNTDGSHKITLHYPDTGTAMAAFVQLSDIADDAALKDRTHG